MLSHLQSKADSEHAVVRSGPVQSFVFRLKDCSALVGDVQHMENKRPSSEKQMPMIQAVSYRKQNGCLV